jgi:hypothetical protein
VRRARQPLGLFWSRGESESDGSLHSAIVPYTTSFRTINPEDRRESVLRLTPDGHSSATASAEGALRPSSAVSRWQSPARNFYGLYEVL